MVRLVTSQAYRDLWGDRFTMAKLGETKIENDQTGFKLATSVGGRGTGERGDRVILDDPHNVTKVESQMEREKTVRFFRESMSNRLNDDTSAIVIIMQRLHESDVSGDVLAREADYCQLMIPMRFEPLLYPASIDGERTEDPEQGIPSPATTWAGLIPGRSTRRATSSPRVRWQNTRACWRGPSGSIR